MPTTVPTWVLSRKRCSLDGSLLHCDPMNTQVYDLLYIDGAWAAPSGKDTIDVILLAQVVHEIGLPRGVFNLVPGFGPKAGEAIARHPQVDMVSFSGPTRAGKRVSELAAATVKRIALELGGRSASVILDGADLQAAAPHSVSNCFLNSGQTCSAWTRMLVPPNQHDAAAEIARAAAAKFTVGDNGREFGKHGLVEYLETKSLQT